MFGIFFVLHILTWGWLLLNIRPQQDLLFLHYNTLFGVDLVGDWWKVFYAPLAGLFIFLVNVFLGWFLFAKSKFAAYLLIGIAVLCQLFLFVGSWLLVFLNV